jgi:fucose permease
MATLLMGWCGLSWQQSLMVMAVPGVLFAVLFLVMFRNSPDEDPHANEAERQLIRGDVPVGAESRGVIPFGEAMKNRSLQIMVVQQFMNAGADVVYTLVMGSYFVSLGVADMKQLGWLVSLPLIGGALGGITGGFLNDWSMVRLGNRRWARSGVGFAGKSLAAVSLFFAVQLPTAAAVAYGLFLVKFFTDWTQPTVWGTCTDIGGRYSATVFSINNMSGNVGALVTPLVIGPLLDYFSERRVIEGVTETVTNFTPMFVLVGALYIGAGLCWLFVDCTNEIRQDSSGGERLPQ